MSDQLTAGVVGDSGFIGGELLRLLDGHPNSEVEQATSRSYERKTVGHVHPNLRRLDLRFTSPEDLESADVLFTATPHDVSMEYVDAFQDAADTVVDLSADLRLSEAVQYDEWCDGHICPEYLEESEYALPELNRENPPGAGPTTAGGCSTTATIFGLKPFFNTGILAGDEQIIVDMKVNSSEGGAGVSKTSSHAERSGIVRPYAPTGRHHETEIEEYLGLSVLFTAHAVDMVRGVAATCHVFPDGPISKGDMWGAFRGSYSDEPFVRTVAGGGGIYRYPEPKSVAGTNYGEVGLEIDPGNRRLVVSSAIDNMMKGSAGQAVHAANITLGLDETAELDFTDFHPVGSP